MPLIQGGPPEWIWERTADPLKWELLPSRRISAGDVDYELRVKCGLEIMRLQFFTAEELGRLESILRAVGAAQRPRGADAAIDAAWAAPQESG